MITIGLGYCGPTDCCLTLSNGVKDKEFGIESESWKKVDKASYSIFRRVNGCKDDAMVHIPFPVKVLPGYPEYQELAELLSRDTLEDERDSDVSPRN